MGRYVSGMRDNFIFLKRVFQNSQGANSGITITIIAVTINKYRNLFPIKVLTLQGSQAQFTHLQFGLLHPDITSS